MGLASFAKRGLLFWVKCFFGLLSEGIIGLRTGGYGMAYKIQRPADFVISKLNLLTPLCSGVLYLYRFGGRY